MWQLQLPDEEHRLVAEKKRVFSKLVYRPFEKGGSMKKCCMECELFDYCPIIRAWIEACEQPMEVHTFYCSEFKPRKKEGSDD